MDWLTDWLKALYFDQSKVDPKAGESHMFCLSMMDFSGYPTRRAPKMHWKWWVWWWVWAWVHTVWWYVFHFFLSCDIMWQAQWVCSWNWTLGQIPISHDLHEPKAVQPRPLHKQHSMSLHFAVSKCFQMFLMIGNFHRAFTEGCVLIVRFREAEGYSIFWSAYWQ